MMSSDSEAFINGNTQASNFSLRMRSAGSEPTRTGSMPNCRKQSDSKVFVCSLKPTNAARAAAFRAIGEGVKVVVKALSMIGKDSTFERHCTSIWTVCKVPKDQQKKQQRFITKSTAVGERTLRSGKPRQMGRLEDFNADKEFLYD